MKNLMLIMTIMFSIHSFAKGDQVIADITFKNSSIFHKYTLAKEAGKSTFKLVFKEGKKKTVAKLVSKSQADFIKNEATRIIWTSEYRKPANALICSDYVNIISGAEKANVCAENKKATAMSYGLLNSISHIFGIK